MGPDENKQVNDLSMAARQSVPRKDWNHVKACADEILKIDQNSAEGWFLSGLASRGMLLSEEAIQAFSKALELDDGRYDSAVELAALYAAEQRHGEAAELVNRHADQMLNSPLYLNKAGTVFKHVGAAEKAYRAYARANELQPGAPLLMANLADACVFVGKIDEARELYQQLLRHRPDHQRNHLSLARLERARDRTHIDQMESVLANGRKPESDNIFLYYALGKEYEDIEEWDKAFEYFERAGDAVRSVANYRVESDIELIDTIIDQCDKAWFENSHGDAAGEVTHTPIFVVGLPRSGTTLTERIVSSHSQVVSVGETQYMQMAVKKLSGVESDEKMTPQMVTAACGLDISMIGDEYMEKLSYRLGAESMFLDKLPFNILYLGFIAKAFPNARLVLQRRNPMDTCFAMYKQVFTWAYKFSYSLQDLARFYPAYIRLVDHWTSILGDRLITIRYEDLVENQEAETRRLLEQLGLDFESDCLTFEKNKAASSTASSVQVREPIYTRSVARWRRYEDQLRPLSQALQQAGISLE